MVNFIALKTPRASSDIAAYWAFELRKSPPLAWLPGVQGKNTALA